MAAQRQSGRPQGASFKRTFGMSVLFMVVKSVLASRQVKAGVERVVGPKLRKGLYRPLYNLFSMVGGVLLVRMVYRGPHRVLYNAPRPLSWLMRAGQVAALVLTFGTIRAIGPKFSGLPQVRALATGDEPEIEPEAQGPVLGADGEMSREFTFGKTRHPNNWFPELLFLLEPKMTTKRAMFCALSTAHVLLGSAHEEYRLRKEYGAAYDRYTREVPFLAGRPR